MSRRGNTPQVFGKSTGSVCPHCAAPEVWQKTGSGIFFEACTKYATCPRNKKRQPTTDTPAPVATSQGGDMAALYDLIRANVRADVDRMVAERLADTAPTTVRHEWSGPEGSILATFEGDSHPALTEVMARINAGFNNLLLVGPAGSGKTTIADQLAQAFANADETYPNSATVVCVSGGISESQIVGRKIPNLSGGESVYESTEFVHTYEHGGVILLDEYDGIDSNVALCLNSALANGYMVTPRGKVRRHAKCYILCAANTWGTGPDAQYVGRNQLDAASLDRFVGATIGVDYDRGLEAKIVPEENIRRLVWKMRDNCDAHKIRRVCGMRMLIAAAKLWRAGDSLDDIKAKLTIGWKPEEVSRVVPTRL